MVIHLGYTFKDWESVLRKAGFGISQGKKHIKATKPDPENSCVRRVQIKRQGSKEVGKNLHNKMLTQAGLTEEKFKELLE